MTGSEQEWDQQKSDAIRPKAEVQHCLQSTLDHPATAGR